MADSIYNLFKYNQGKYGQQPRLTLTAGNFYATSISHYVAVVGWDPIKGSTAENFIAIRLVRNYDQYPTSAEDGQILVNAEDPAGNPALTDTGYYVDRGLSSGRFAYYRIWVLMDSNFAEAPLEWFPIAETYTLLPLEHVGKANASTLQFKQDYNPVTGEGIGDVYSRRVPSQEFLSSHDKFMGYVPEMYRGSNSQLNDFMTTFSLTLDEMLTYADLVIPDASGRKTAPTILGLQAFQLGLPQDPAGVTRGQKRLVRNAIFMYSRKGTKKALETFVESLTLFQSAITVRPNLMLSIQDSSFYKDVGFWEEVPARTTPTTGAILLDAVETTVKTAAAGDLILDDTWAGKAVVSAAGAKMVLGTFSPITKGIPVKAKTSYSVSFNHKAAASITNNTVVISWYTANGALISSSTNSLSMTSGWATRKKIDLAASPIGSAFMCIEIVFATTGTYYFDRFQVSETSAGATYYETRMVDVFLKPSKTNFMPNPSFESLAATPLVDNTSHWTGTMAVDPYVGTDKPSLIAARTKVGIPELTEVTDMGFAGSNSIILDSRSGSDVMPVAGDYVTTSLYAKAPVDTLLKVTMRATKQLAIESFSRVAGADTISFGSAHPFKVGDFVTFTATNFTPDVAGSGTVTSVDFHSITITNSETAPIDYDLATGYVEYKVSDNDSENGDARTMPGIWWRVWGRLYIPTWFDTNYGGVGNGWKLESQFEIRFAPSAGSVLYDGVQIENSYFQTDYFDGSLAAQGSTWAGIADNSVSYKYDNRPAKLRRLQKEIVDYLPLNTVYQIRDYWSSQALSIA